jgi:hypothetical protein
MLQVVAEKPQIGYHNVVKGSDVDEEKAKINGSKASLPG